MGDASLRDASRGLKVLPTLARRRAPLADPREQLALLDRLDLEPGGDFAARVAAGPDGGLFAAGVEVLQLNLGRLCNQTCAHCHVDAGPDREEDMSRETAEACMRALAASTIPTVDVTGGAPEMSGVFEYVVTESRRLGRRVLDRCNLTILTAAPFAHLAEFLAEQRVEVVASLPHYRRVSTDRQRGDGVFERSLEGLRRLNAVGYGRDPELPLTLVTNPVGAFLPAGQASLEREWKREMKRLHDVDFDALFTITNMPIARYLEWLEGSGNTETYLRKLVDAYNPAAAANVMCRTTVSVAWDGTLHDCDFNQMLGLPVEEAVPRHVRDFDAELLGGRRVVTARHCFGCTAGAGSSCGGSLDG